MSVGVIIARLQPIHNGHIALIEKSMNENQTTLIFVGSADKFNKRNPIPISMRMQLVNDVVDNLRKKFDERCVKVIPLNDLTDESDNSHDWGFYLYSNIVSHAQTSNFTIYYSDGFEIITTWFPPFILRNNVSMNLIARNSCVAGISATKVREYITNNNDEELNKVVPDCVFDARDTIRNFIKLSNDIS